jgi:hypothetical protein
VCVCVHESERECVCVCTGPAGFIPLVLYMDGNRAGGGPVGFSLVEGDVPGWLEAGLDEDVTGGWWRLNWGGRACGNGWCQIGGMSSNTSNTHGLMPFHCLRSSHYYEPSSPQQPPLEDV